jgi:UDP-glucose:(indol-3-yl)acetate beta-D-glucosyltransferase
MEVTDGPEAAKIQKRALELKEAAKKAVADGGSSDANIDQFIREFIEK